MLRKISLIALALLFSNMNGWSQEVTGRLEGKVEDAIGAPLSGANVHLSSPSLQGVRGTVTDERGIFRMPALPVGEYEVEISHVGHRTLTYREVEVRLGRTTSLGVLTLPEETVAVEGVIVSGARPTIDGMTASVGGNLAAGTYEVLPTARNFHEIVQLLPQANASYLGDGTNVAGSTGLENAYFIDGINTTDPYLGAKGADLPYNFVKEIEVKVGGYEAEYGKALGSVVNVITHSGGDELHGSVFGFLTNSGLAAEARRGFGQAKVDAFATYDVGFSLGGAIVRDRLWFFSAYNAAFADQDVEIPGLGFHRDERRTHVLAGKLTWRATERTDVTATLLSDPTTHHSIGPFATVFGSPTSLENSGPFQGLAETGGLNFSVGATHRAGERWLIEASVARHQRDHDQRGDGPTVDEALFIDYTTGIWEGGFGVQYDVHSVRTTAKVGATLFAGQHTLKAGAEFEDNLLDLDTRFNLPGLIQVLGPDNITAFVNNNDNLLRSRVPSAYVQDSWQVGERLRLNYGLRWSAQFFIGAADSIAQSIPDQFQPRLGLIYEHDAGAKLSASYGRFYQQLPLSSFGDGIVVKDSRLHIYDQDPRIPGAVALETRPFGASGTTEMSRVGDLQGEHFDEFTIGYERLVAADYKVGVRGIYRALRQAFLVGADPSLSFPFVAGNPGRGAMDFLPEPERTYRALEFTVGRVGDHRLRFAAAYVLSRTRGNYSGLYGSDIRLAAPNNNFTFQLAEHAPFAEGLLPNDRTHVFKLHGSYRLTSRLTAGSFFTWQSGTPLNEFGSAGFFLRPRFLAPRGALGRTPSLWDLSVRFTYRIPVPGRWMDGARLVLDGMHIGNPREVVDVDQVRYSDLDRETGEQALPNSGYGKAIAHQPPMSLRVGMEVDF